VPVSHALFGAFGKVYDRRGANYGLFGDD